MSALRPKADIGLVQIMLPPTSSPCPVTPRVLSETDRCRPLRSGTARAPSALLPRRLRAGRRALYSTLMPQSWRRPQHQKQTFGKSGLSLSLADSAAIHALTGRCPDARGRDIR